MQTTFEEALKWWTESVNDTVQRSLISGQSPVEYMVGYHKPHYLVPALPTFVDNQWYGGFVLIGDRDSCTYFYVDEDAPEHHQRNTKVGWL